MAETRSLVSNETLRCLRDAWQKPLRHRDLKMDLVKGFDAQATPIFS